MGRAEARDGEEERSSSLSLVTSPPHFPISLRRRVSKGLLINVAVIVYSEEKLNR